MPGFFDKIMGFGKRAKKALDDAASQGEPEKPKQPDPMPGMTQKEIMQQNEQQAERMRRERREKAKASRSKIASSLGQGY